MKERPILFSAPMVRAILDGTKTQTRRVVTPAPPPECSIHYMLGNESWLPEEERTPLRHHWEAWHGPLFENRPPRHMAGSHSVKCPYGQPGDRLWVREMFHHEPADYCWEASVSIPSRPAHTAYRADYPGDSRGLGWKPSIHMPRALSRILLEITGVRVERLQDISEDDAIAEGWQRRAEVSSDPQVHKDAARDWYSDLWEQINGPGSWEANPWVWVVEFKRVDAGAMKQAA